MLRIDRNDLDVICDEANEDLLRKCGIVPEEARYQAFRILMAERDRGEKAIAVTISWNGQFNPVWN